MVTVDSLPPRMTIGDCLFTWTAKCQSAIREDQQSVNLPRIDTKTALIFWLGFRNVKFFNSMMIDIGQVEVLS